MVAFSSSFWAYAALAPFVISQASAATVVTFEKKCLAFKPESFITNSTRTVLSYVTAGTTLTLSDNVASCGRATQAVTANLCRIGLSIPTSKRSSISFEIWLPEDWSGRFLGTGNGGIDGC
jgi:feruloyl esterase